MYLHLTEIYRQEEGLPFNTALDPIIYMFKPSMFVVFTARGLILVDTAPAAFREAGCTDFKPFEAIMLY